MLTPGSFDHLKDQTILITGGTGSLGKALTRILLDMSQAQKIIIFSRDELKQFEMQKQFEEIDKDNRLRYFLGDIRDKERCMRAFKDVDVLFHTAALKQVPAAEYNPFEFIKTNIIGSQNVIEASIDCQIKRVIALSTDKAANPINLYGSTKFCADKLFVAGNHYAGFQDTSFSVVRYGNVVGSRGSVIPLFAKQRQTGVLHITDERMTRFWITLQQAAHFVLNCLREMQGAEVFVPKIPSMKMTDLAETMGKDCKIEIIGIRPGEKLHEVMIPEEVGRNSVEFDHHYVIKPSITTLRKREWKGKDCKDGFAFTSDNNDQWLSKEELIEFLHELKLPELSDL